ncbi:MAG: DHHA1 domain-containing protein [Promethearchaeota archaeon]
MKNGIKSNKDFENNLETIALEFLENLENYEEIVSIHHTDADGISSGAIIKEMIKKIDKKIMGSFRQLAFNLDIPWNQYLQELSPSLKHTSCLIFSDLGPSGKDLCDFTEQFPGIDIYILDHHLFHPDPNRTLPENVYNTNPTQFGLHGLKEIIGATLNYLFAKAIDEKNSSLAWIAVIGMGGDTLDHINDYQSYNRLVVEEAAGLDQIEIRKGICAFGGMYERIDKALAMSVLPYIPKIKGDREIAKNIIQSCGIEPKTKVIDLLPEEVDNLVTAIRIPSLKGEYLIFPKMKGLMQFGFEHAQIVSIFGHQQPKFAHQLLGAPNTTKEVKDAYLGWNKGIITNLTTFVQIPKDQTNYALLVDLTGKIDISMWSDTASFASINKIYDIQKVIFVGGENKGDLKLSVRCTPEFISKHNGNGANVIIKHLIAKIGGEGGGHGLAGGMRIRPEKKQDLLNIVDGIIDTL